MGLHGGNTIDGWGYKLPEMGKDIIIMKENWVLSYLKKPMDSVLHYTRTALTSIATTLYYYISFYFFIFIIMVEEG